MRVGYGQSTKEDDEWTCDVAFLEANNAERVFYVDIPEDRRPVLDQAIAFLRPGDLLIVSSLNRLGRTLDEIIGALGRVGRSGAAIQVGDDDVSPGTPLGDALLPVSRYLEERLNAANGQAATATGLNGKDALSRRQRGRPNALSDAQRERVQRLVAEQGMSTRQVARRFGVSTATIYRILQES